MWPWWFSNRCPHFTVENARLFVSRFGDVPVTLEKLFALELEKPWRWLSLHQDSWLNFEKNLPTEISKIQDAGGGWVKFDDDHFPELLRQLHHPPAVLMFRGDLSALRKPCMSVVGSRHPTHLGRSWVRQFVSDLTDQSVTVVSGGARGIDFEAHFQSLICKIPTVAFLPGGVLRPYPRTHGSLFDRIVSEGGALVSEFVSNDIVRQENFHQRNRLIAGSSRAVVIVEASEKSGTLMTAHKARDENREIFVLPGSPLITNYAGSLNLIASGASVALSATQIFEALQNNFFEK